MKAQPERLNGFPVIHRAPHRHQLGAAEGLLAVLVYREDDALPFVVASWAPHMGASWHQGDYLDDLDEALAAFADRAGRPSQVAAAVELTLSTDDAVTAASALEQQAGAVRDRAADLRGDDNEPAAELADQLAEDVDRIAQAIRRAIGDAQR